MVDDRSIARKQEHEPHSWFVRHDEEETLSLGFKRGLLMACPCGWGGWVHVEAVAQTL